MKLTLPIIIVAFGLLPAAPPLRAAQDTPASAEANRILQSACQYLDGEHHFMLKAEIWREKVVDSGEKLQFTRTLDMEVKQPDRMHAEIKSALSDRGFWYDGTTLTVMDHKRNLFGTAKVSDKLDAAIDEARDRFDIDIPLADLATSDPYASLTANVDTARYLGIAPVLGVDCHHLAFTQKNIDWQIWIETGPKPLIRKLVITHKGEKGEPQFTALITQWDFADHIADLDFVFQPPPGASKISMRGATPSAPQPK